MFYQHLAQHQRNNMQLNHEFMNVGVRKWATLQQLSWGKQILPDGFVMVKVLNKDQRQYTVKINFICKEVL